MARYSGFRIHGFIKYKSPRSSSSKVVPDHHISTTMYACWHNILIMKCSVSFMSDVKGVKTPKKFNFCFVSLQNIFQNVCEIIVYLFI